MFTALRQFARPGAAQAPGHTARAPLGHRVKPAPLLLVSAVLLVLSPPQPGAAQTGGGHTLFGDLKVDDRQAGGLKPISFDLILYDIRGGMVSRQTVVVNGRYRFEEVRNGDYEIVVQMENTEVARVRVSVYNAVATDVRRDIALEWKPVGGGKQPDKAGVAPVVDHYERSPSGERLFSSAEEAVKKKQYAQAEALLRQTVGADPKDFEAWTELGTVAFIQQNLAEADDSYRRALELRPTFGLALLNLGKLKMAQKEYKGAVEFLRRAVSAWPKSADANHFLGEAYLNEALTEIKQGSQAIDELNELARQAIHYLNEALRLDPAGKAEIHLRLANIFNVMGMKAEAVAECEKFLAEKPDYPDRKKLEQYIRENKKQ